MSATFTTPSRFRSCIAATEPSASLSSVRTSAAPTVPSPLMSQVNNTMLPARQPVDKGFPNGSADIQFTNSIGVPAVANKAATVNVAYVTAPPDMPLGFALVVERCTSLDDTPMPAPVSTPPAVADTNVNFVASKLRSIWNDPGAVVPPNKSVTGTV